MGKSIGLGQACSKTTMMYSVNLQWFGGQGLPDTEMVCLHLKAEKDLNLYSKHLNATGKKHLTQLVREIDVQYKYKAGGSRPKVHFKAHDIISKNTLSFLRPRSIF